MVKVCQESKLQSLLVFTGVTHETWRGGLEQFGALQTRALHCKPPDPGAGCWPPSETDGRTVSRHEQLGVVIFCVREKRPFGSDHIDGRPEALTPADDV